MVQLASRATNKAQSPVVAATTTATTMIVPIVIVQTPVCASERCLDREMVGKRARMLTSLISFARIVFESGEHRLWLGVVPIRKGC